MKSISHFTLSTLASKVRSSASLFQVVCDYYIPFVKLSHAIHVLTQDLSSSTQFVLQSVVKFKFLSQEYLWVLLLFMLPLYQLPLTSH